MKANLAILPMKNLISNSFIGLVSSENFYKNILKTAKLSSSTRESSFCVYGSGNGKTYLTKPLQEYDGSCMSSKDIVSGMVFDKKGYGLWKPQDSFYAINAHFHNQGFFGIPSKEDLKSEVLHSRKTVEFAGSFYDVNTLDIIGLKQNKDISLFCYQMTKDGLSGKFFVRAEAFIEAICDGITNDISMNKDSNEITQKALDTLNSSGKFRAKILNFSNLEEYLKETKKLEGFSLFEKEEFCFDR